MSTRNPSKRAHLIANKKSGKGAGAELARAAVHLCRARGWELVDYDIQSPEDFVRLSKVAVTRALEDGGVVVAAGGDGTIRGVAQQAQGTSVRFAAVPCGTFNFFARAYGLPEDPEAAFILALEGEATPVRLGEINEEVFLINASMGLYAKAIRERKNATGIFGRSRWVATLSTAVSLFSHHRLLNAKFESDGRKSAHETPMIFIGNNALQLRDLKMSVAACMKRDLMAVVLMRPIKKVEMLRLLVRGLFKALDDESKLQTWCVQDLVIETRQKTHTVALDGEMFQMASPFRVRSLPGALNLIRPTSGEVAHPG